MEYFLAMTMGTLSAVVGQRSERSLAELPPNPALLRLISGVAALCCFALFIGGFWESWWLPFVGLGAGAAFVAVYDAFLTRQIDPPVASIGSGLIAVIATFTFFFS